MPGHVICIGNFDGVHLGHQALLRRARALAQAREAAVMAMTFEPSPMSVLRPDRAPLRLMDHATRLTALRAAGADVVTVLQPDAAMLALNPEQFVDRYIQPHAPVALVEGPDFHFGKNRSGNVAVLTELGRSRSFTVEVVPPQETTLENLHLVTISSSLIRWLLTQGRVLDAARCLGRYFSLHGQVTKGEQRGRTIAVPTANLDPQSPSFQHQQLPRDGVYAGTAVLPDGMTRYPAAISIGMKPTFGKYSRLIEAHLLGGFAGDLYGQPITLEFVRWVREQQAFPNAAELIAQLQRDITTVRRIYAEDATLITGEFGRRFGMELTRVE